MTRTLERTVRVTGTPSLANDLAARLPASAMAVDLEKLVSPKVQTGGPIVAVLPLECAQALDPLLQTSLPLLTVTYWAQWIYLGPFRLPRLRGCARCLLLRVAGTPHGPPLESDRIHRSPSWAAANPADTPLARAAVGALVAAELETWFAGRSPRTPGGVRVIDTASHRITWEPLVPDPQCPHCAVAPRPRLPRLGSARARARFSRGRLRSGSPQSTLGAAADTFIAPHLGPLTRLRDLQADPFAGAAVAVAVARERPVLASGRTDTFERARAIAVLEALERYCGFRGGEDRQVVTACYRDVAGYALHPLSLGVHPAESYRRPGFAFTRFRPTLPLEWVWGLSLTRRRRLLVPRATAFYGRSLPESPAPRVVDECSSGCALGRTLEEAAVHALLELIERDALMLTWYRRLTWPELALNGLDDREARDLLRRVRLTAGGQVRAFLATLEHGFSTVFAVVTSDEPGAPSICIAASAHPDPMQSLKNALYELGGIVVMARSLYPQRRKWAEVMAADPNRVRLMHDHCLAVCPPSQRQRFDFLLQPRAAPQPFPPAGLPPAFQGRSPAEVLSGAVKRLAQRDLEVVLVDQTAEPLARLGLRCARVVVPGLVPLTFGHELRRTEHLPRLRRRYPNASGPVKDIGRFPHPFL